MSVRPAKTQISLGIRPVRSEFSLSAWRNLGPLATHWAHSEDSEKTGRMQFSIIGLPLNANVLDDGWRHMELLLKVVTYKRCEMSHNQTSISSQSLGNTFQQIAAAFGRNRKAYGMNI